MRISEWSADVCSSDRHVERILFGYDPRPRLKHIAPELCLPFVNPQQGIAHRRPEIGRPRVGAPAKLAVPAMNQFVRQQIARSRSVGTFGEVAGLYPVFAAAVMFQPDPAHFVGDSQKEFISVIMLRAEQIYGLLHQLAVRSEEHTSELQSLMRISYAVFCLKKKT